MCTEKWGRGVANKSAIAKSWLIKVENHNKTAYYYSWNVSMNLEQYRNWRCYLLVLYSRARWCLWNDNDDSQSGWALSCLTQFSRQNKANKSVLSFHVQLMQFSRAKNRIFPISRRGHMFTYPVSHKQYLYTSFIMEWPLISRIKNFILNRIKLNTL